MYYFTQRRYARTEENNKTNESSFWELGFEAGFAEAMKTLELAAKYDLECKDFKDALNLLKMFFELRDYEEELEG